jgi:stage II sporulation protein D
LAGQASRGYLRPEKELHLLFSFSHLHPDQYRLKLYTMAVKSKIISVLGMVVALAGLAAGIFAGPAKARPFLVRVAIIQDAPSLWLSVRGPYEVSTLKDEEMLYRGKNLRNSRVLPALSGIKVGSRDFKVFGIKIAAAAPGNIYINGRRFRGEVTIIRKEDLKLLVINNLDIEEYIKGVLYHEISHRWPLEAIKAQAVAARTFAVYQAQISAARDFDLTSDVYSQVYGGRTSETYRTSVAVNRTRGEVLNYQGKIFPAFFHATCAGHTEDAAVLWQVDLPPLKGVACNFCVRSPHFKWDMEIPVQEMENKLVAAGFAIGGLEDIIVKERDASGRVARLKLVAAGNELEISGKDFRGLFDPKVLRSTNFTIQRVGDDFKIAGKGWGHGVGLCQWGAYFQSLQKRKYDQILQYYYPGSVIAKLKDN